MSDAKLVAEALREHAATYNWTGPNPLVEQLADIIERRLAEREMMESHSRLAAADKVLYERSRELELGPTLDELRAAVEIHRKQDDDDVNEARCGCWSSKACWMKQALAADALIAALKAEVARLEAESEGRRVALDAKAEESRREWQRAERAEADLARLTPKPLDDAEVERLTSIYISHDGRCHDATRAVLTAAGRYEAPKVRVSRATIRDTVYRPTCIKDRADIVQLVIDVLRDAGCGVVE
jgi:hypothetical protein